MVLRIVGQADDGDDGNGTGTGTITRVKEKTQKPSLYKVLMLNDDYTPMEFVVHILEAIFGKSAEEATNIMLMVHQKGVGVCGVYTFDIAESKVTETIDYARKNEHPLHCTLEKE